MPARDPSTAFQDTKTPLGWARAPACPPPPLHSQLHSFVKDQFSLFHTLPEQVTKVSFTVSTPRSGPMIVHTTDGPRRVVCGLRTDRHRGLSGSYQIQRSSPNSEHCSAPKLRRAAKSCRASRTPPRRTCTCLLSPSGRSSAARNPRPRRRPVRCRRERDGEHGLTWCTPRRVRRQRK